MRIIPECYGCLARLVELTVTLATPETSLREEARRAAQDIIQAEAGPGAIPALIANHFHRVIREITGNPDPFLSRKRRETALLAKLSRKLLPAGPPADLLGLLALAAAGNALDFFRPRAEVTQNILADLILTVSHHETFQGFLEQGPGLLLYLADNAGEQYLDLPLIHHLRQRGWEVHYVVKGGPVQNDLTRADLEASGLAAALAPITDTGTQTVGLILQETSAAFQTLYHRAGLIVAKGMGHFETLGRLQDPRLFFLLQAKCTAVAQALTVPPGSFLFLWSQTLHT